MPDDGLPDIPGMGNVDFVLPSSDNDKQDGVDEVIKMDEQEPLNDPACEHVPKYEGDEIGDTVSVVCHNCPYGWYIPKKEAVELGLVKQSELV